MPESHEIQFFRCEGYCDILMCGEEAVWALGVPDHPISGRFPAKKLCKEHARAAIKNLPHELRVLIEEVKCPQCDEVFVGATAKARLAKHLKSYHEEVEG